VIKIRVHHVEAAKIWLGQPIQEVAQDLIQNKYISESKHPFVSMLSHYLGLWEDVSQQFKLQVGGLDYICRSCPKLKRGDCDSLSQEERIVDVASWTPGQDFGRDSELVAEHRLDIHRIYTASELRDIMKF